ncbi:hypothetical protein ACJIZ3_006193 [Penstemon smallii]|uniref:Terpene synthase metal-binding domain-containing protein n=1 Tax=Penstemon smallii TaxID=265156 RepID=A0ABD3S7G2_9LAMI
MKKLVRAYYEGAKWLYNNHIPTMDEYMKVAIPSSGYMMVATTSLVGMHMAMGDNLVKINKYYFDWVSSEPLIVRATSTIARLMDDMAGYGFEQKKSAVHCYMNQNNNSSKEETFDELKKQVSKAWKDINQECLDPMAVVSMPILMRIVNSALVIYLLYKDEDGYTNSNNSKIKDIIKSVLVEPVTL